MSEPRKTIFLDIDGTLIANNRNLYKQSSIRELLPGVRKKLDQWYLDEAVIIVATGRKESMRKETEEQLTELGVFYDQLIMGLGRGLRIVINDTKPDNDSPMAQSYSPKRNTGLDECPY